MPDQNRNFNVEAQSWVVINPEESGMPGNPDGYTFQPANYEGDTAWTLDTFETKGEAIKAALAYGAALGDGISLSDADKQTALKNLDADLVDSIDKHAKEAAKLFVNEFSETLDPAKTDWDSVAWTEHDSLNYPQELRDDLWSAYQMKLVVYTEIYSKRLTKFPELT